MTIYRERLWASPWVFISTALVIPASLLVFLPINLFVGVIVSIALYAACVVVLVATSPVIEVTNEHLSAGRATLPLAFAGEARGFEGEEATLERGQRLDARAWLLIRGWVSPVVTVQVNDANDPTPYWLVSTRRPGELIRALAEAKAQQLRS
ncbi:DUF3093 domain-containing protein [Lacisediminihabitans sp.]|uniref:DUF3093 domain-containing protein n=1 Tax=Lacisediminihabitans sp. TaxID=2787631 RepID=UPI00374DF5B3